MYGNVVKVKILFRQQTTALIQMEAHQQALCALQYLDRCEIWKNRLRMDFARMRHLKINSEREELSHDYTNERSRYRWKGPHAIARMSAYVCKPSSVLHVSQIDPTVCYSSFIKCKIVVLFLDNH